MTAKPRRGKIYLGAQLQSHMLRRVAIYWLLYHVALLQGMFIVQYVQHGDAFVDGEQAIPFWQMLQAFAWQNASLVVAAVAVGPLLLWDVCRLTHRIAGPLLRLEKTLQRMARGEHVSFMRCREGDMIQGVEQAFNAYLASLDARDAVARMASIASSNVESQQVRGAGVDAGVEAILRDVARDMQPTEPAALSV